jgi:hypothetical protein
MCTATIIPFCDGIRLGFNRDESPARPLALPPRVMPSGLGQAAMPIDPQSGGTWIGVNDRGLTAALLNVYEAPRSLAAPARSRGTIIPQLLASASLDDAFAWASQLDPAEFAPFRLLLLDRKRVAIVCHTQTTSVFDAPAIISGPLLFTSSGLGDAVVERPRRALFEGFVAGASWSPQQQDAYHRHSWPDRRHLSVCMQRPTALTVSYTVIELTSQLTRLCYSPAPPDHGAEFLCAELNGESN